MKPPMYGIIYKEKGTPQKIDPDDIAFEKPSPRPDWTTSIPTDPDKIYFVGQAFEENEYHPALEKSMEDAYLQVAMAIGTQVEYSFEEIAQSANMDIQRQAKSNLLLNVLNNVRNLTREDIYFLKTTEDKYYVSVLYSISRSDFEFLLAESIDQAKMQAEAEIARAQSEEEIVRLQGQLAAYEKLLNEQRSIARNARQESMRYQYYRPTAEEIARAEEFNRQGEEIDLSTGT